MNIKDYPFAKQFLTNSNGNIKQVVVDLQDYEKLLESVEDNGLYKAMLCVREQTPLSLAPALAELDK